MRFQRDYDRHRVTFEGRSVALLECGKRGSNATVDPGTSICFDERQRRLIEAAFAREEGEAATPPPPIRPDMIA